MTVTRQAGRPMDVEGMIEATIETTIEATIEAAATTPPIGAVGTVTMMITTMIIMVMIAMDIVVEAATIAAE